MTRQIPGQSFRDSRGETRSQRPKNGNVRSVLTLVADDEYSSAIQSCIVALREWLSIVTIHGSGDTGAVPHVGMKHTLSFGNGALMSKSLHSPSKKNRKAKTNRKSALVVTVDEIRDLLGIGRAGAYALAKRLGRRVSGKKRGRLLVLRTALDEWLRGQAAGGAS